MGAADTVTKAYMRENAIFAGAESDLRCFAIRQAGQRCFGKASQRVWQWAQSGRVPLWFLQRGSTYAGDHAGGAFRCRRLGWAALAS